MQSKNPFLKPKQKPLVVGHRGVPLLHQENTAAGIRRAVELGLDAVEFDVMRTKDGKLVLFHDEDTERLTGVPGKLQDMTWDQVSQLRIQKTIDMGKDINGRRVVLNYEREEPIPLLEEVLSEFASQIALEVELKPPAPSWFGRKVGAQVGEMIKRLGVDDSVIVVSFDLFKLLTLEKATPELHSGITYCDELLDSISKWVERLPVLRDRFAERTGHDSPESVLNAIMEANKVARMVSSSVISSEWVLIDDDTISTLRAKGILAIGAFTLFPLDVAYEKRLLTDDETLAECDRLASLGVDWIETDDPVRLRDHLYK